jgi:hypothetical protein
VLDGLCSQIEPAAGIEVSIAEQLRLPAVLAVTPKLARDLTPVLPKRPERSPGLDTRWGSGLALGEENGSSAIAGS